MAATGRTDIYLIFYTSNMCACRWELTCVTVAETRNKLVALNDDVYFIADLVDSVGLGLNFD